MNFLLMAYVNPTDAVIESWGKDRELAKALAVIFHVDPSEIRRHLPDMYWEMTVMKDFKVKVENRDKVIHLLPSSEFHVDLFRHVQVIHGITLTIDVVSVQKFVDCTIVWNDPRRLSSLISLTGCHVAGRVRTSYLSSLEMCINTSFERLSFDTPLELLRASDLQIPITTMTPNLVSRLGSARFKHVAQMSPEYLYDDMRYCSEIDDCFNNLLADVNSLGRLQHVVLGTRSMGALKQKGVEIEFEGVLPLCQTFCVEGYALTVKASQLPQCRHLVGVTLITDDVMPLLYELNSCCVDTFALKPSLRTIINCSLPFVDEEQNVNEIYVKLRDEDIPEEWHQLALKTCPRLWRLIPNALLFMHGIYVPHSIE